MTEHQVFSADALDAAGLNRQHVFDLASLPDDVLATLGDTTGFTQLLLVGHGGRRLWECVQASGIDSEHPIDDYTVRTLQGWLAEQLPGQAFRIVYPGEQPVGLQALGKLAGWHTPSPFFVGVDARWGSWYAYRAAVLTQSRFLPFLPVDRSSPCLTCDNPPCLPACPAGALEGGQFDLRTCSRYRLQPDSRCALGCLARRACPVGREHQYDDAQIMHSYSRSLAALKRYFPEFS